MKLKNLCVAMTLSSLPITGTFAAAMDRSGQSMGAFFQPGNYFEAGLSVLDPNVSGKAHPTSGGGQLSDMAGDYYFPTAAIKVQATDNISLGLLYDQPFGADAEYSTGDPLVAAGTGLFHLNGEATKAEVKTQNLSLIVGFQPTLNWNIYGGAVYQTVEGNVKLRGAAYGAANALGNYNNSISEEDAWGWLAGIAYQIPEIALKASLTYRSEIEHEASTHEWGQSNILAMVTGNPANALYNAHTKTSITTPQSVNLDFQTGVMADTVAFANLRWVNWKEFAIRPPQFGQITNILGAAGQTPANPNGFDLIAYTDDQISATVGVGRKFSEKWAGNLSVGWDSGAGNPISTLGPTEGYWNVGLGAQFSPAPNYFIAGGIKYFMLGDAKSQPASMFGTSDSISSFEDNDAWAYGLKIGYRF